MKKVIVYFFFILILFLLQTSFFCYLKLADVVPNLLIIFTVSVALMGGRIEGCLVGFFCGMLLDISYGSIPGLYALGFLLTGYFAGFLNRIFYREDITLPIIIIAGGDLFYGLYMFITGFLSRGRTDFLFYLRRIILPETAYTVIIAIFLYRLILFIYVRYLNKGSESSFA